MKVQELRVGNYLIDEYSKIFQVKQIGTGLIESYGMYIYEIEEIKPIELTEEILLKCGFVKFGKLHDSYIMNPFIIEIGILGNKYCFRKIINKEESYMIKEIKHLHQLQNLYYALCNQELNIQL